MTFRKVSELANKFEKKLSFGQRPPTMDAQAFDVEIALGADKSAGNNHKDYYSKEMNAKVGALLGKITEIGQEDKVVILLKVAPGPTVDFLVKTDSTVGAEKLRKLLLQAVMPGMVKMLKINLKKIISDELICNWLNY